MGSFDPLVLFSLAEVDLSSCLTAAELQAPQRCLETPGVNPRKVAAAQLLCSLLKKYTGSVHSDADSKALDLFLKVNKQCTGWSYQPLSMVDEAIVGEVRKELYNFWWLSSTDALVDHPYQILESGRVGPGASLQAVGTDFYTKLFASPLTSTSTYLYTLYRRFHSQFPDWLAAEGLRESVFGGVKIISDNRLGFVPKSNTISRTTCTEPNINMFWQLGMGELISKRLKRRFNIELETQPEVNREMAFVGSFDQKDSYVTIDLSSASDSISLGMLKYMLPAHFFNELARLRSLGTRLPDGSSVPLNMVSTMGNGFTFPLQTLLFSCCVSAAYTVHGLQAPKAGASWSVFGDDIVVRKSIARTVVRALNLLGFKVNADKTFLEGPFRESCGEDYYSGLNVRGVYIRESTSRIAPFTALNRLMDWSARTGISLPSACRYLQVYCEYLPVPLWESEAAGLRVPLEGIRRPRTDSNGSFIYHRLIAVPTALQFDGETIVAPKYLRKRFYNASGAYLAFLGGYIKVGRLAVRNHSEPTYRVTRSLAPNWDYVQGGLEFWEGDNNWPFEQGPGASTVRRRWIDPGRLKNAFRANLG